MAISSPGVSTSQIHWTLSPRPVDWSLSEARRRASSLSRQNLGAIFCLAHFPNCCASFSQFQNAYDLRYKTGVNQVAIAGEKAGILRREYLAGRCYLRLTPYGRSILYLLIPGKEALMHLKAELDGILAAVGRNELPTDRSTVANCLVLVLVELIEELMIGRGKLADELRALLAVTTHEDPMVRELPIPVRMMVLSMVGAVRKVKKVSDEQREAKRRSELEG